MSNSISFSIVIPTHNSSKYIHKTLDNIFAEIRESDYRYEIIIVDDLSEDIDALIEIIHDYKNVILINKEYKSNAADSRNIGFKKSKADIVFFLDSDDFFLQGYITRRINLHHEHKAGVIFGRFYSNNTITVMNDYDYGDFRKYLFGGNGDIRSSTISICKTYHKKTLFDKNQNKHQDWGFGIRCYDNKEVFYYDSIEGVNIDTNLNEFRMSNKNNLTASDYFIEEFKLTSEMKYFFVKMHLINTIFNKDKSAIQFYRKIISGSYSKTNVALKVKLFALFLLSYIPKPLVKVIKFVL